MTSMPEAALAAELGMRYACVCIVVNAAAGLSDEPITLERMRSSLEAGAGVVRQLLDQLVQSGKADL
jgi:5'-methylthioinosine phosphorylase